MIMHKSILLFFVFATALLITAVAACAADCDRYFCASRSHSNDRAERQLQERLYEKYDRNERRSHARRRHREYRYAYVDRFDDEWRWDFWDDQERWRF